MSHVPPSTISAATSRDAIVGICSLLAACLPDLGLVPHRPDGSGPTGVTGGALAFLGVLLGTIGACLALIAGYHNDLGALGRVPVGDLSVILVGLPVTAAAAGWLLVGREPPALARQPL